MQKKEIKLEEIRKIQLDIMCYFDKICADNNLRYYLAGGTLIGAVRHKGFIPWDDDIDISMPRSDYNRFIEIMNQTDQQQYKLLYFHKDGYYDMHGRLVDTRTECIDLKADYTVKDLGVFIDIFPLDGIRGDKLLPWITELRVKYLYNCEKAFRYKQVKNIKNPAKRIIVGIGYFYYSKISNYDHLCEKLLRLVSRYDFDKEKKFCSFAGVYRLKEVVPREYLDEIVKLEFEGHMFDVMKDYDSYLRHYYGDYMQLPPKEKQVAHHEFETYWKETL